MSAARTRLELAAALLLLSLAIFTVVRLRGLRPGRWRR